jgi:hypothetical protein
VHCPSKTRVMSIWSVTQLFLIQLTNPFGVGSRSMMRCLATRQSQRMHKSLISILNYHSVRIELLIWSVNVVLCREEREGKLAAAIHWLGARSGNTVHLQTTHT